ncbi:MAG TPA: hypothetical protein VFZ76_11595 [Anaerolineales bacterium]
MKFKQIIPQRAWVGGSSPGLAMVRSQAKWLYAEVICLHRPAPTVMAQPQAGRVFAWVSRGPEAGGVVVRTGYGFAQTRPYGNTHI